MGIAIESLQTEGPKKKIGIDFDGTGVKRQAPARWATAVKELFAKVTLSGADLKPIPDMDHTPVELPPDGLRGRLSLYFQSARRAIPGIPERLAEYVASGIPVYIISGRDATVAWDRATRRQADREGIPYEDVVLRPVSPKNSNGKNTGVKISGIDSKAHGIATLGITEFFEDNRKTAVRLAERFPDVEMTYIDYRAHIGKEILNKLPNLRVIPAAEWKKKTRKDHRSPLGISDTRNSPFRELVAVPIREITKATHKELPWLTPTHLNILGAIEVCAGAIVAASRNPSQKGGEKIKTAVSSALVITGSLLDAFDGALARLKAVEDPNSVDFQKGGIYDVLSDRFQELALALSRAWSAAKMKNKIGTIAALTVAVTNPWPSIARATSELKGKPVPESGKGITGLIGTRPGKAGLGTIATEFPNPKGWPLQPVVDTAITVSNIWTTAQRLCTALGPTGTVLPEATRREASTRLKFLTGAGIVTGIAGGLSYWLLKDQISKEPEVKTEANFLDVMKQVESYCAENELDHRFVGGSITEFIGPNTRFNIDTLTRTVALIRPKHPTLRRNDGSVRDIDLIVFTPSISKYGRAKRDFAEFGRKMTELGVFVPKISVEAARHPAWPPKRSKWKQFVTAWEILPSYYPRLAFGDIRQAINPESIEPWTLDTGLGIQLTMLHPIAHALCYELRVPSGVKKKDREEVGHIDNWVVKLPYSRIGLVRGLARKTIEEGIKYGVDYNSLFKEWRWYIDKLSQHPDRLTAVKSKLTGLYWDTIGEWLTHHTSAFNDKMSG